jgi:hypothetical protein
MITEVKAPNYVPKGTYKIFLAGSIEMGKAIDWQTEIVKSLSKSDIGNVTFLNPRRDSWDSSWIQDISNPQFNEQVTWELDGLDSCDLIILYLAPGTMSPISLLELGLHAKDNKMIVCCPKGFWRKGNVQMICDRFDIPLVDTLEDLIQTTTQFLTE